MGRFRLRYETTDLELPKGAFVIGRSTECDLALDDALVSRRHAALHTTDTGVEVEDLGSRNGLLVNGRRVTRRIALGHMDRITIGSQDATLIDTRQERRDGLVTREVRSASSMPAPTSPGTTPHFESLPEEDTSQAVVSFQLLSTIADKSLALGRFEEAERMIGVHMELVLARAESGEYTDDSTVRAATRYALQLASGLRKATWVDFVFRLSEATRRVLDTATIDDLHNIVRNIRYSNPTCLRTYLGSLERLRSAMSPAERFALKRLEALDRVITA